VVVDDVVDVEVVAEMVVVPEGEVVHVPVVPVLLHPELSRRNLQVM